MKTQIIPKFIEQKKKWVLLFYNPQSDKKQTRFPFGDINPSRVYSHYYETIEDALIQAIAICRDKNGAYCVVLDNEITWDNLLLNWD